MQLFRLVSDKWRGFFTGKCDERQALIGFHLPGLLAILFDDKGIVVDVQTRTFTDELLFEWDNPPYDPRDPSRIMRVKGMEELVRFKKELGFAESYIQIQAFNLTPSVDAYITELPVEYREILDDPDQFDEDEQEETVDYIRKWREAGMFAFGWDIEYYMNADGTINTI